MTTEQDGPISAKWDGDYLNRVEVARFLTSYLNSLYQEDNPDVNAGHFVLNLNASWGQGKTFLLTKWADDLKQAKYPVVKFDAWKNDFSKDPLVGFIAELEKALDPWLDYVAPAKALLGKAMNTAKKLISVGARIAGGPIAGQIIEGLTGLDLAGQVTDKATDYAEKALTQHRDIQSLIDNLIDDLRKLIEAIELEKQNNPECDVQLPFYIFVDELDRCRPTYAIELLENIKHLFGVKGVFFIIATNKEQLCHSIGAVYGRDFNSSAYLGRFFDQEYILPKPDNWKYANYLFEKYAIKAEERLFSPLEQSPNSSAHLTKIFALYSEAFDFPLRDQEQTIHRIKAILATYQHDPVYFDYLVFLLMLRRIAGGFFDKYFGDKKVGFGDDARLELLSLMSGRHQKNMRIPKVSIYDGRTLLVEEQSLFTTLLPYIQLQSTVEHQQNLLTKVDKEEKGTKLEIAIFRETGGNKSATLSILEYPKLVKQVGHLS